MSKTRPRKAAEEAEVGDGLTIAALLLIAVWWPAVLVWYLAFGIVLVRYRILRGALKRKAEALRRPTGVKLETIEEGGMIDVGVEADYLPRQLVRLNALAGEALRVGAPISWA